MLWRFCLYGFLKNQRYFEPFLVLVLLDRGLTFLQIGLLIGFREVLVNLLEVPSGGMADLWGRRRALVLSFLAYISSFVTFTLAGPFWTLFVAMALYAVGEAFRSGTHKAMVFAWLARQGRTDEKAAVYGRTRSWSQIGSAVSVLIAVLIVFGADGFQLIFLWSAIPYALGIVNLLGYPADLDGRLGHDGRRPSLGELARLLLAAARTSVRHPPLRRLLGESMLQRGTYATVKDYLQPILEQTALMLPLLLALAERQRLAVVVGGVYCLLHLLSATASRQAHRVEARLGGSFRGAVGIWLLTLGLFLALWPALAGSTDGFGTVGSVGPMGSAVAIAIFVVLGVLQNLWKPLFLARLDEVSDADLGATVLSIESQSRSLFVALAAPLLGALVDHRGLGAVAWLGVATSLLALLSVLRSRPQSSNALADGG